jgi:alpha-glucosidase
MRLSDIPGSGTRRSRPRPSGRSKKEQHPWWQRAAFYEIATISFQDSNGDGRGDLKGLLSRNDYLQWLGIGAVWLTPIYPSPMLELGYDISDFCDVHPGFGTLAQFDELLDQLHSRDIR